MKSVIKKTLRILWKVATLPFRVVYWLWQDMKDTLDDNDYRS